MRRPSAGLVAVALLSASSAAAAPGDVVSPSVTEDNRLGSCGAEMSWSPGTNYDGVVILRSFGSAPTTAPTNGTFYSIGSTVGNATVVYADDQASVGTLATRYRDGALPGATGALVYYRFFAHDSTLTYAPGNTPSSSGVRLVRSCGSGTGYTWQYAMGSTLLAPPSVRPGLGAYAPDNTGGVAGVEDPVAQEEFRPLTLGGTVQQRIPMVPFGAAWTGFASGQNGVAYAFDGTAGVTLWSTSLERSGQPTDELQGGAAVQIWAYANAAFQAAQSADLVFFGTRYASSTANRVYALNVSDGGIAWTYAPTGAAAMDIVVAEPAVDYTSNSLYVTSYSNGSTQASVRALSTTSGSELWRAEVGLGAVGTSPAPTADGQLLVGSSSGSLLSLDPGTGAVNWTLGLGLGSSVTFQPDLFPLDGSRVVFSTAQGGLELVSYTASSASVTWTRSLSGASSPTGYGSATEVWVGASDGNLHEVSLSTGADVATVSLAPSGTAVGTPTLDSELHRLYVGTSDGVLHAVPFPLGCSSSSTGACDDGNCSGEPACSAGTALACTTSCGTSGALTCSDSCGTSSCGVPIEECNGIDDNCNNLIDEVFQCHAAGSRSCTTACGGSGTQSCQTTTCTYGVCAPSSSCCIGASTYASGATNPANGCQSCQPSVSGTSWTDVPGCFQWDWVAGADTTNQNGVYGTKGTSSTSNYPGARGDSAFWLDSAGNLWLFGGFGLPSSGGQGWLNDLWEYTPSTRAWTWVSGADTIEQAGDYGPTNACPGARVAAAFWIDSSNDLWLFGGSGFDANGTHDELNDLWEYSPATQEWTWMAGGYLVDQRGVYGTEGTASTSNIPGARDGFGNWVDGSGNFWLFGGYGYDGSGNSGKLNDLWELTPSTGAWTWVSGSNTANPTAAYGTEGTGSTSNHPDGRLSVGYWQDSSANLWLFGGFDDAFSEDSDLWEYTPTTRAWTWISGTDQGNAAGVYGTLGTGSASNYPGGRNAGASWSDSSGNFWLFGGQGYDGAGNSDNLNDLWEYSPAAKTWTWVAGADTIDQNGVYGTEGTFSTSNIPGARYGAAWWVDSSGNVWLFGGYGTDGSGNQGFLNDLWEGR